MSKVDEMLKTTRFPPYTTTSNGYKYVFKISPEDGYLILSIGPEDRFGLDRIAIPKEVVEQLLVYLNENYGE